MVLKSNAYFIKARLSVNEEFKHLRVEGDGLGKNQGVFSNSPVAREENQEQFPEDVSALAILDDSKLQTT